MAIKVSRTAAAGALLGSMLGAGAAIGTVSADAHLVSVDCPTGSGGVCEGHEHEDWFYGTPGYDNILGSGGVDASHTYAGGDDIDGGGGADWTLHGDAGRDDVRGGDGGDEFWQLNLPGVSGGDGEDRVDGNQGSDYVYGGKDDDTLYGGADPDTCAGGPGNDVFYGCETVFPDDLPGP